jgi:hypothetical protein
MTRTSLTPEDVEQLAARGIAEPEARRQLALLRDPPPRVVLDRPCTIGDGISKIGPGGQASSTEQWRDAAARGRVTKFVPASGAASRMFKTLLAAAGESPVPSIAELKRRAERGDQVGRDVARFVDELAEFPFCRAVCQEAGLDVATLRGDRTTAWRRALVALLDSQGLGFAETPKGLLPFHGYAEGSRTPFEEHLVEAAGYARQASGTSRLHFTVSEEHESAFRRQLEHARETLEPRLETRFEVEFSQQSPATDTLAAEPGGRPFRDENGRLLLRPGGHGALIENLDTLDGDIVVVKNIDNVVPDDRKGPTLEWKRVLIGRLAELQSRAHDLLLRLDEAPDDPSAVERALEFARHELDSGPVAGREAGSAAERAALARDLLDRPFRICGVVRNTGEPGGGPFWVREPDGRISLQIVESSEVDLEDPGQQAVWGASTHFNPVDIVCGVRDRRGRPYRLARYVDDDRVFISRKSSGGRDLLALERPGLWNGAMSRWNTLFVEVPEETFAPVKTIFDLLRPEHRG